MMVIMRATTSFPGNLVLLGNPRTVIGRWNKSNRVRYFIYVLNEFSEPRGEGVTAHHQS